MQQRAVRIGLIAGIIGLFVTAVISAAVGICGPLVGPIVGGIAGFLAVRGELFARRGDAARRGAVAGGIAGTFGLVGQILGGVLALFLILGSGKPPIFGTLPDPENPASQAVFWTAGIGVGFCFGIIGALLAAGAGALAAYLTTPEQPVVPPAAPLPPSDPMPQ